MTRPLNKKGEDCISGFDIDDLPCTDSWPDDAPLDLIKFCGNVTAYNNGYRRAVGGNPQSTDPAYAAGYRDRQANKPNRLVVLFPELG